MSRISLLKVGAVVALLLPFGVVAAEATTIPTTSVTCGFGNNASHCGSNDPLDNVFVFDGGAYSLELDFIGGFPNTQPPVGFNVTVTDSPLTDPVPVGEHCLNFTGTADGCRQFSVVPGTGAVWNGNVLVTIAWLLDTNDLFPNGTTDQVRMLHLHNGVLTDVTVEGSYFSIPPVNCQNPHGHPNHPDPNPPTGCDPGDSGVVDAFSDIYEVHEDTAGLNPLSVTAVPEPATLVLFGSGLMAIAAARRRLGKR
jgi:hypothetical protein